MTDADYPAECEFCDLELIGENDMKMHLKISRIYSETKFKCEDCDFCCEHLQTHLYTCESYECENCFFRVHHLSQMEVHMDEKHEQQNLNIIHGKIDRKDENLIKTTEHLRFTLLG